CQQYHSLAYSF
nr:immunoglobulin light chain junction region [Macaca mulatta]